MNKYIKDRNRFIFYKRKSHLNNRVKRDYIDNGVAYIPCKVSGMSDILSSYSIEGYEVLNSSFELYVENVARVIPSEYPIVLDIIGGKFTRKQKEIIEYSIKDSFAYDLGVVEKRNNLEAQSMFFSLLLAIVTGILTTIISKAAGISKEIIVILFYFFVDTIVDYALYDAIDYRKEKLLAGRLACVKVTFSSKFDKTHFTDEEIKELYEEIKKY